MDINEDRLLHISHKIHDRLYLDELVDYTDEDEALRVIKKVMIEYFSVEDQIDDAVRYRISSLKRGVVEGTPEWDVMYRKYSEEEHQKRKR